MWGFSAPLRALFRSWSFTNAVTATCIVLYVVSLASDPLAAVRARDALDPRGVFDLLSPSGHALDMLGMTGSLAWDGGRWWTLLTAIYLHGSLLHILFNVLWIRQLGPAVEELYGPARLVVIFSVAGVAGFLLSNTSGVPFTIGASGSIFGLLGAMVAYGRRRGGLRGRLILRQYGQWALVMFILGFFLAGVNNLAHAGGFLGGLASALALPSTERRDETAFDRLLATTLIALTLVGFGLALWTALGR